MRTLIQVKHAPRDKQNSALSLVPALERSPSSDGATRSTAVLICTYRGAKHISQQIDSVVAQSNSNWCMYVSDDGSDDGTLEILESYRAFLGESRLKLYQGPQKGFAANFFSLIGRSEVEADCYAFTDQDDVWEPDKLDRALKALAAIPSGTPAIYGSRTTLIDVDGRPIGHSRHFKRPSGFGNALVQNMVSGNTMVLNADALNLIRSVGTDLEVSAHDWWAYLLVTGCGGKMIYDPEPTIRYRQHSENLYGANVSVSAIVKRIRRLLAGDYSEWNAQNIDALRRSWSMLTTESRARVELFDNARSGFFVQRLLYLQRSRVYRQTWDGQLGLMFATLTGRL